MGLEAATVFLSRLEFHYTPKHASWLNMAEIEIGILDRQCSQAGWPMRRAYAPKCWLGSNDAIKSAVELTGSSRARTPTGNPRGIM
jgi:hypothetical protein